MEPLLATLRGVHTVRAQDWASRPGVVYALHAGAGAHGASSNGLLSDFGWVTTSLVLAGGSGADIPDASWSTLDWGTPGSIGTNASSDLLQSPAIFADPMGFYTAGRLLGSTKPPLNFIADFWGALTTDSANETTSGFGLVEAGGTAGTAADSFAWIYSNGANLKLESGAGAASLTGPAVAQQLLLHRLVITRSDAAQSAQTVSWYTSSNGITFTLQGTIAVETDLLPLSFGMFADTTNRPAIYGDSFFYYI